MPKLKPRMCSTFTFIFLLISLTFFGCSGNTNENNNPNDNYENTKNFILHAYDYEYVFVYNILEENLSCHKMNYEADNWYKITLPKGDLQFCFAKSDAGENQTQPFTIEVSSGDEKWYKNGNLYDYKPTNDDSYDDGTGNPDNENTGNNGNESADSWTSNIYLEIMPFSYRTMSFNDGKPIRLTSDTAKEFKEKLNTEYKKETIGSTKIYYSLHQTLLNLENYQFPDNLKSINIITFTDGFDLASAQKPLENMNFNDNEEYGKWIKEQIDSRTFSDKQLKLTCKSVALEGSDITDSKDKELFSNTLTNITSDGNPVKVKDLSEVSNKFSSIADNLVIKKIFYDYELEIPYEAKSVRMIFDGSNGSDAATSSLYFEGTINDEKILTIQNRRGITVSPMTITGSPITDKDGEVTGNYMYKLKLEFNNDTRDAKALFNKENCKQFIGSSLIGSKEYDGSDKYHSNTENFSTVIYLLLDCTRSLDDNNIEEVRKAAINFVDKLSEKAKATN